MSETEESEKSSPSQRSYGRGMFDGLRLAGVQNPGDFMNNAKLKSIEAGLTGIAKKIYELIPVQSEVDLSTVIRKLGSIGSHPAQNIVKGCVGDLIEKGLVRGNLNGNFQRIPPKLVVVSSDTHATAVVENAPVTIKASDTSPLGKMADIECRMKALCRDFLKLSDEIGSVAIEVEQSIERIKKENQQFEQLKSILTSLKDSQ